MQSINRWQQIAPFQAWEYKRQHLNLLLPARSGDIFFSCKITAKGLLLPQSDKTFPGGRGNSSFQVRALALCNCSAKKAENTHPMLTQGRRITP